MKANVVFYFFVFKMVDPIPCYQLLLSCSLALFCERVEPKQATGVTPNHCSQFALFLQTFSNESANPQTLESKTITKIKGQIFL